MLDKEKFFKKYTMIFFVEYLVVALVLLVVGFLKVFDIIKYNPNRLLAYNIITLIGVAYIFFDFFFNILSKTRRAKVSILDKVLPLIVAIYLLVFDILVLAKINQDLNFIKYSIGAVLLYAGSFALFSGIYHLFKPTIQIKEAIEEAYEEKLKELEEENSKDKGSAE